MPRALLVSTTIVAAFQLHLAAASSIVEDAPITPPVAALAAKLDVEPSRDRLHFMAEVARRLYAAQDARTPVLGAELVPTPDTVPGVSGISVPVPLPASLWSRAVFRRTVPGDQLVAAILSDRRAAWLCRGLSGLDEETLEYVAARPSLVTFLYERAAAVFAAFGGNLRIRAGRIVAPGGDLAVSLWEAVAREPLANPERFARVLFGEYDGRLAYLYDVLASADAPAQRFAIGLWIADEGLRYQRFRALVDACIRSYREWRVQDRPFTRPLGDLALLLLRVRLRPSGAPAAPAGRALWAEVFGVTPDLSGTGDTDAHARATHPVDAAWLVDATGGEDMYQRMDRLDQFAFAQRMFDGASESEWRLVAGLVKAFHAHPMLMLSLERMGMRSLPVYEAAVRRAAALGDASSNRRFWTFAQFQGGLALLARMRRVGSLGASAAEALITSLCAVPLGDGEYKGGIAQWIRVDLSSVLPQGSTFEERLLAGLAGAVDTPGAPRLMWEGQLYRVDLAFAERQRLNAIRGKQGGRTVDLALAIDAVARTLGGRPLSLDDVHRAAQSLATIAEESGQLLRTPAVVLLPPGVQAPRDGLEWITDAREDLERIGKAGDARRAARTAASLNQLADTVLADALLSVAYAVDIGDPEGAALLASNVALRHDFGFARREEGVRARTPWLVPRQDFQPGVPWHITGSLLGLDIALAPLALRRFTVGRVGDAPKLSSIERAALVVGVALLDPSRLTDRDRDAIVAAIARGERRVQQLVDRAESADVVADALGLDGWRRRSLSWSLDHDPGAVGRQFSLVDLVTLGGGAGGADLDAWGTLALYSQGCACTRFPSSREWRLLEGRPQLPMIASTMADITLTVALRLREMEVPALLVRTVLTGGIQEFMDATRLSNPSDWWSLSRQARDISRQRVEDRIAAAAAVDGPLVPEDGPDASEAR